MNDELWWSQDRAEDVQDRNGEQASRRRRKVALIVGGIGAAVLLAGAVALGSGVLDDPDTTLASPTQDGPVATTSPVAAPPADTDEPTAEEPTTDEPVVEPTTDAPAPETQEPEDEQPTDGPLADGVLTLEAGTIEDVPLDASLEDLVAAITAELGEPVVLQGSVGLDCSVETLGDAYIWGQVFEVVVGPAERRWGLETFAQLPVPVDLPGSLELGQTADEVRSVATVVRESKDPGGNTVLELEDGVAVAVRPGGGVFQVMNPSAPDC